MGRLHFCPKVIVPYLQRCSTMCRQPRHAEPTAGLNDAFLVLFFS